MVLLTFSAPSYDTAFIQGAWSSEEEGRLLLAIEELARNGKTDMSTRGFWGSVSKALGGTRTPKQCQSKWCAFGSNRSIMDVFIRYLRRSDTLRGKVENQDKTRRWKEEDTYILVCKCMSWSRLLFWLDTKCTGLLLLMSARKQTSIGSLSATLHGTCGVAIFSSKSGDVSRPSAKLTAICAIVVSTRHSFCPYFSTLHPDRHRTSHHNTDETHHNRHSCLISYQCMKAHISNAKPSPTYGVQFLLECIIQMQLGGEAK